MAEEIQEAIQIIRVGYDGIEIAMKICGGTLEQIKKAVDFMIAVMDHEKTMGKTDMRKLLTKGGDLQVLQFPADEIKKVEKMAKKYGLLYSVLPDINKNDGMSEIIFHTEAVPRVNMMLQKLKVGKIATFDDYLKNGDEKEIDKVLSFLKEQKRGNDNLHTEEAVKASEALTKLMEKVGNYAMEKKSISVEEVKENFSLEKEQAEKIVGQLERIGVISKEENGKHKVQMDKDMFINRMRGYQKLANRIEQERYLTITIERKNFEEAKAQFATIEASVQKTFRELGAEIVPLSGNERIKVLYDYYHLGKEDSFDFDIKKARKVGADFRNDLAGGMIQFYPDYFKDETKFCRALFIKKYPSSLSDRFLNEITSLPVHSIISIDVVPIPKDMTTKILQKKYLGIESDIIKQQRVRNRNNDFSSEISYNKRIEKKEIEEIMDDVREND